jgi:DNA-binding response OmpR family regulator
VGGSAEPGAGRHVRGRPVLLVIDPAPGAESLVDALSGRVDVHLCPTAADGLLSTGSLRPDVVLVSATVADLPCATVVSLIRRRCALPVVVSTDLDHGELAGAALAAGAAACIPAPYRADDVLGLVRSLAVRSPVLDQPEMRCGALVLDPATRTVLLRGAVVDMPPREFRLLHYLMARRGTVVSRVELWESVWEGRPGASANTVSVHVRRLRRRLGDDPGSPTVLTTVGKSGYRLLPAPERPGAAQPPGREPFTVRDRIRAS